ncbi:MAG: hypothetical protein H8E56_05635 [Candidatus Marinimicrobia bacterium]|nr:hypothetical protein [Candidatus Neomarinimicrobiota bacterium]
MKHKQLILFILIMWGGSVHAASGQKWEVKTKTKLYQNVEVFAIEKDALKITNRKGDSQLIPIVDITKIEKVSLIKEGLYGACGGYLGMAAGAFFGWPLFPKWGHDEGHANGLAVTMGLGAMAGVIYRKKVVGFIKNRLGFPVDRSEIERLSIDQKKTWIRYNVLQ